MAQPTGSIPMSSPFWSTAPERTIAMAEQVMDDTKGKKQSVINAEVDAQFADLELTSDDLDAIINGVDNYGAYLVVTDEKAETENDFNVYRYADGDEAEYLCFSRENGNKYYANGELGEADANGRIRLTFGTGNYVYTKNASTGEFEEVADVKFKSGKMSDGETDYYDIRLE